MKKKRVYVVLGSLFLVTVAGGFFYYYFFYQTPPEKWGLADYSPAENYVIENNRVINEEAGISFDVPGGWRVERKEQQLVLYSPDAVEKNEFYIEKGCRISIGTIFIKTKTEAIKGELSRIVWSEGIESFENKKVDKRDTLHYKASFDQINMHRSGYYILEPDLMSPKMYSLESSMAQKEKCLTSFEEVINSVSIK